MVFNDQRMRSSLKVFQCFYEVIVDFGEITLNVFCSSSVTVGIYRLSGIVTRVILKYQPSSYGPLTPTLGFCESGQGPRMI
ncbi:hypothetical protein CMV_020204 [Castanea mollissima]|uniref:Uncharacterized protein n=1 Tax=Castanea mollissima TaxID=60419 RepID=A0A8J4QM27_9ROSI|nr:hypothetical protein CMV_020204 [Castanea mollissima]